VAERPRGWVKDSQQERWSLSAGPFLLHVIEDPSVYTHARHVPEGLTLQAGHGALGPSLAGIPGHQADALETGHATRQTRENFCRHDTLKEQDVRW